MSPILIGFWHSSRTEAFAGPSYLLNGSQGLGWQPFLILCFSWQNSSLRSCWAPQKEEEESTEEIPGAGGEGCRTQGPGPCGEVSSQDAGGSQGERG